MLLCAPALHLNPTRHCSAERSRPTPIVPDNRSSLKYTTGEMESRAKKLLKRRDEIDRQIKAWKIERKRINESLRTMGLPGSGGDENSTDTLQKEYMTERPFAKMSLAGSCIRVFKDCPDQWLTTAQVEYLVKCGGYTFSAYDTRNSVAVTVQRLAAVPNTILQVKRVKGAKGNEYMYVQPKS